MPITYEHRVPASTLGGLALAAGQEQYEAQRGREDRARAVQLAQMRQQQQMQNQRMAYDAASTQYRTMADYNRFVAGAQMDAQQRGQDQQNRLALQNNQNELAAGREEVRWDRAQEVAGQQDTLGAWKEYVASTLPSLDQTGKDILNTHAGKVRSIVANQKFSPAQKATAVSQVLEEVQGLGLNENYATQQMYEPGKAYNAKNGETFLWDGEEKHLQGRHYDGLIKPVDMSDSDWRKTGRNEAWMDEHTEYETRDEDGKRVRHFISNGDMTSIADEDDLFLLRQDELKEVELEKERTIATADRQKNRADFITKELSRMDAVYGSIADMVDENQKPATREVKIKEYRQRMEMAEERAGRLFPEPVVPGGGVGVEEGLDELGAAEGRPLQVVQGGPNVRGTGTGGRPRGPDVGGTRATAAGRPGQEGWAGVIPITARPPSKTEESATQELVSRYTSLDARGVIIASGSSQDPQVKARALRAADILEKIKVDQAGIPTPEQREYLNQVAVMLDQEAVDIELRQRGYLTGADRLNQLRRGQAMEVGRGEGGTGERVSPGNVRTVSDEPPWWAQAVFSGPSSVAGESGEAGAHGLSEFTDPSRRVSSASKMEAAGIMAGTPEGDFVLENIKNLDWAINAVLENRKSSFVDIEDPTTGEVVRQEAGLFPREEPGTPEGHLTLPGSGSIGEREGVPRPPGIEERLHAWQAGAPVSPLGAVDPEGKKRFEFEANPKVRLSSPKDLIDNLRFFDYRETDERDRAHKPLALMKRRLKELFPYGMKELKGIMKTTLKDLEGMSEQEYDDWVEGADKLIKSIADRALDPQKTAPRPIGHTEPTK